MNIYSAFTLFLFIIIIYLVIAEVFTVLFRFAGLDEEKARFQVISLLTGSGFTTAESELVTASRQRRRLARITMMFGYVFNITFVSAFVNIFLSFKQREVRNFLLDFAIPIAGVIGLTVILRIPKIRTTLDQIVKNIINRFMGNRGFNPLIVIDSLGDNAIVTVTLTHLPEELVGKKLKDNGLKTDHNIIVLLVESKDGKPEDAHADTVLVPGDKVTLYGDYQEICRTLDARELYVEGAES